MANYGGTRSSSESNTVEENIPLTGTPATPATARTTTTKKNTPRKQGFTKKYYLAILPLVTTLREGLEAVVFIGGSAMTSTVFSIIVSVVCGIAFGSLIGYLLYQGEQTLPSVFSYLLNMLLHGQCWVDQSWCLVYGA